MRGVLIGGRLSTGKTGLRRAVARWLVLLIATVGGLVVSALPADATIGVVRGTVTNATTGQPLPGAQVQLLQYVEYDDYSEWTGRYESSTVATNAAGAYSIYAPQGTYRLAVYYQFEGGGGSPWHDFYYGGTTAETASDVAISSGATTSGINVAASLPQAGRLAGLASTSAGEPVESAMVAAYRTDVPDANNPYYTRSGLDGRYVLGLEAGT